MKYSEDRQDFEVNGNRTHNFFDLGKFNIKKTFSDDEKLDKFDNMCQEYDRLMNYRQMLYVMITQNSISSEFNDNGIIIQKKRRLSAQDINSVHNEINSLNSIISWIETFILDEPNLTKIKEEEDENTGADT
jgi:hypothetical protein